jgi:Cys-tRNA(Pro)/Cys-tRNA(Cys) deacylase
MSVSTPATQQLDSLGISYRLHEHERPVRSLEQAARERGLSEGQVVRTLLFRLENRMFVLVLMPGTRQVSWMRLRQHLGVSRLTTATGDEVMQMTGYLPGAVSPFGLPQPIRLLADDAILAHETLSVGAGVPNAGLILSRDDLLAVLQPEVLALTEDKPSPSGAH